MLQSMRKHAKFFYFLFFMIIISFVFWGVGGLDQPSAVSVAEIDGERITAEEYWRVYENTRQFYREQLKGQFSEEFEKKLNLKETVLNRMIEDAVLLITAKKLGLTVSDNELQDYIVKDPKFIRDGIFRKDVYIKTLQLMRVTTDKYENSLREQILMTKVKRLIESAVDIAPLDAKGGESQNIEALQTQLTAKRQQALISYIEGMKQKMKIKINKEHI